MSAFQKVPFEASPFYYISYPQLISSFLKHFCFYEFQSDFEIYGSKKCFRNREKNLHVGNIIFFQQRKFKEAFRNCKKIKAIFKENFCRTMKNLMKLIPKNDRADKRRFKRIFGIN